MTRNYVVVGGLSGIGLSIVDDLASESNTKIIASTRSLTYNVKTSKTLHFLS